MVNKVIWSNCVECGKRIKTLGRRKFCSECIHKKRKKYQRKRYYMLKNYVVRTRLEDCNVKELENIALEYLKWI